MGKSNSLARLMFFVGLCVVLSVAQVGRADPGNAVDHVLVKFKPSAAAQMKAVTLNEGLDELLGTLALPAGAHLSEPAVNSVLRMGRTRRNTGSAKVNLERFFYLHIPPGLSVEECVERISQHPLVEYAEPDGIGTGGMTPNDPYYSYQWHHRNTVQPWASLWSPWAWNFTQGSSNVIVAVLDTGIGSSSEFAEGRVLPGYNFVSGNANPVDDHGHGTCVTAILAAEGNNNSLIAGVDWYCRIMPVKVLDSSNSGLYSWWAQGIDFAVANGAKIINLSAGGSTSNSTLTLAIQNAIAQGAVFVTITHNDGNGVIRFPGRLRDCITVGATDQQDRRCSFSCYGPEITLCAPGTNICTITTGDVPVYGYGTSYSAPQVSGVCALLASIRPEITQEGARLLLCAGAQDGVGDATDTPGFDNYYGWGRLNAYNSILLARTWVDHVEWSNGVFSLSWISPPNASNKEPYMVQFSDELTTNIWFDVAEGFAYDDSRTYWSDTNSAGNIRFYRVYLHPLP